MKINHKNVEIIWCQTMFSLELCKFCIYKFSYQIMISYYTSNCTFSSRLTWQQLFWYESQYQSKYPLLNAFLDEWMHFSINSTFSSLIQHSIQSFNIPFHWRICPCEWKTFIKVIAFRNATLQHIMDRFIYKTMKIMCS